MAENYVVSTVEDGYVQRTWTIKNWNETHKVVTAAEASCYVEIGNPKVELRFFLRPKEKLTNDLQDSSQVLNKWYSLCVEVLTEVNEYAAIEVTASFRISQLNVTRGGTIPLTKSKGKIVEVIDPFIYFESNNLVSGRLPISWAQQCLTLLNTNTYALPRNCDYDYDDHIITDDAAITFNARLFRLTKNGNNIVSLNPDVKENAKAEESYDLTYDLKNMFAAHNNYADLKLESKDHMTLDAHKFILAARCPYLHKCIDGAMKKENFNGTMKMNINGKPLVVILHWMYTGELHETSGNVMEEVVDAGILFELTHLMKLLDKKLITICNKENMFRLYQVAQKYGMPSVDDISVFIRENL